MIFNIWLQYSFNSYFRYKVFDSSSLVVHEKGQGSSSFGWNKGRKSSHNNYHSSTDSDVECTSLFIEPVEWMSATLVGTLDGKVRTKFTFI